VQALIDGDIVCYRVAWTVEDQDDQNIPMWRADEMLDGILQDTGSDGFRIFLSGSEADNFRYKIYPRYKESRKGKPKPKWLEWLKEHLIVQWGARIANGMEADDALGINQRPLGLGKSPETIICSIDKDLMQIPGHHYNFVKKELSYVTEFEGLRSFYKQILTGDSGDDIPGIYGIGPSKAAKFTAGCRSEADLLSVVYKEYQSRLQLDPLGARMEINRNGSLLRIRRVEEEPVWVAPWDLILTENNVQEIQAQERQEIPREKPSIQVGLGEEVCRLDEESGEEG
jgi:5'-3' exonuclease